MKKLLDADIIPNYTYAASGSIDDGEELNCGRCGLRSTQPGTRSHGWTRIPNRATHLPRSIELCDKCNADITALRQLG